MRIITLIFLLIVTAPAVVTAQVPERFSKEKQAPEAAAESDSLNDESESEENFWDRVVYGGDAGLQFGSYTIIFLAPSVGYKFTDRLVAGGGFIYLYQKLDRYYNIYTGQYLNVDVESQTYGPKVFARYAIVPDLIYAGTQVELINHEVPIPTPSGFWGYQRSWTPVWWLEAGYLQNVGQKGYVQLGLRLNVLHDYDSPYGAQIFPAISFFF